MAGSDSAAFARASSSPPHHHHSGSPPPPPTTTTGRKPHPWPSLPNGIVLAPPAPSLPSSPPPEPDLRRRRSLRDGPEYEPHSTTPTQEPSGPRIHPLMTWRGRTTRLGTIRCSLCRLPVQKGKGWAALQN